MPSYGVRRLDAALSFSHRSGCPGAFGVSRSLCAFRTADDFAGRAGRFYRQARLFLFLVGARYIVPFPLRRAHPCHAVLWSAAAFAGPVRAVHTIRKRGKRGAVTLTPLCRSHIGRGIPARLAFRARRLPRSLLPGSSAPAFPCVGARYIVPVFTLALGFRVWRLPRRCTSGRPDWCHASRRLP